MFDQPPKPPPLPGAPPPPPPPPPRPPSGPPPSPPPPPPPPPRPPPLPPRPPAPPSPPPPRPPMPLPPPPAPFSPPRPPAPPSPPAPKPPAPPLTPPPPRPPAPPPAPKLPTPREAPPLSRPPPAKLEVPPSAAKPKEPEQAIHVMPGEYYGVPPKTAVKKAVSPPPAAPPKPPPPPKPAPKPAAPPKPGAPKKKVSIVLMIGAAFLVVIAVGGFLFLRSLRPPAPTPVANIAPVTPPPPLPIPISPPPPPPPPPIRPGVDTDSDGLTDLEETLYGSNPRNPDTDRDSFIDGNEVFHLYDPTEPSPATLQMNPTILTYQAWYGKTLVPKSWTVIPPSGVTELQPIAMTSPTGEVIRIRFEAFHTSEDPRAAAARLYPDEAFTDFKSKAGFDGLRNDDQRLVLLELPSDELSGFFVVSYELGTVRTIEFLRTFEMVVNSLNSS